MEVYKDRLKQGGPSVTFGAFEEAELVGIVTVVKESKIKLSHRANIASMYVLPQYRKRGIGRNLMIEALRNIKERAIIEQVYLSVSKDNIQANKLYNSLGFIS